MVPSGFLLSALSVLVVVQAVVRFSLFLGASLLFLCSSPAYIGYSSDPRSSGPKIAMLGEDGDGLPRCVFLPVGFLSLSFLVLLWGEDLVMHKLDGSAAVLQRDRWEVEMGIGGKGELT